MKLQFDFCAAASVEQSKSIQGGSQRGIIYFLKAWIFVSNKFISVTKLNIKAAQQHP